MYTIPECSWEPIKYNCGPFIKDIQHDGFASFWLPVMTINSSLKSKESYTIFSICETNTIWDKYKDSNKAPNNYISSLSSSVHKPPNACHSPRLWLRVPEFSSPLTSPFSCCCCRPSCWAKCCTALHSDCDDASCHSRSTLRSKRWVTDCW